ncbi:MAG: glutamate synthase [Dehalococcoidia bacterium]|nr:glutamate synthase [Dehalococcoidia bacterium]|tara:strand:- start:718 stop:2172 length:1455 start_codon:yes stop_codon:yes gene_type:complete
MGKASGFKEVDRNTEKRLSVDKRVKNWKEIYVPWSKEEASVQASRCMDCGVPFCNNGCPLGNLIPEWNDLVYKQDWETAYKRLSATNNFPEFTGRICPAPCEAACTLSINNDPVTIEMIEKNIIEKAFESGFVKPEPPTKRTGKKVAVIGSGPAGLAASQQLNRAGHLVTVFERSEEPGGLLRYGIPEFKLEKSVVKRRIDLMEQEGIKFVCSTNVGIDITAEELKEQFDAICLSGGSTVPRDLPIDGRNLDGVHFAMEFLTQPNWEGESKKIPITAKNKNVVVIGGGDTGADCLGTSIRQGAKKITQIEILPEPPKSRKSNNPWPEWPMILRTSSAHEEGGERDYSVLTKNFYGNGKVEKLICEKVEWVENNETGRPDLKPLENSAFEIEADLVLLAMGFVHPLQEGLLNDLSVEFDQRGNVKTDNNLMTNIDGVFSCGDMQRGQSLVVHAIASGRSCAKKIDLFLEGKSSLPDVRGFFRNIK